MLTDLVAVLEPLGLTEAIRLVAGSVVVGLVLIMLPNDALTGAAFLLQRALLLVLLWPRLPTPLLAVMSASSAGSTMAASAPSCR